ncbi:MAG: hypothetical protein EA391_00315 [Balneolaceae bacterium]|nr:MAG: hypothetical protein EA391_00315 [Balneolaceae bacterium]
MKRGIHPFWGLLEIVAVFGGFQAFNWMVGPRVGEEPILILFTWLLWFLLGAYVIWFSPAILHKMPKQKIGWISFSDGKRAGSFRQSWKMYASVTLIASAILVAHAFSIHSNLIESIQLNGLLIKFGGYIFSGIIQAAIFFGFILIRFKEAFSHLFSHYSRTVPMVFTIILTSATFSIFHYPNPELMIITLSAGISWSLVYYLQPNILLMGFSHAILGTLLHQVVQLHMRIGPFYHNPELYVIREIVPGLKQLIGNLF